jgi:hypothetical protein
LQCSLCKICPNLDFWYKNISSGNRAAIVIAERLFTSSKAIIIMAGRTREKNENKKNVEATV